MVGTTNARKYLRKGMGSRRFWPMEIPMGKSVNLAAIKNDRDQLFAEAVALYRDGHPYWHMPKELLDPIIEARLVDEPLIPAIRDMVKTLPDLFTTTDVYQRLEGSGLIQRGLTRQTIDRIEGALRRMDFEQLNMGREVKWRYPKNAALVELMSAMTPMSLESLI